ncbi:integral peroxisomal membrane peroxin-domain-containing protein [Stachybotrys elegans]|uniref:Integral peroxisomal membrane peroxin-domain-containing protein n=1 Tax=Stachybotrys elegans TaxID=80388 RepID=A0A8K0SY88_9HYPO|nr:integral peroxisomal membrane peroxin-domain-containing protein [Stachybotrys elegans]
MDDFTTEMIASRQDEDQAHSAPEQPVVMVPRSDATSDAEPAASPPTRTAWRGGLAAIREKANMQDHLIEKLLERVIPANDHAGSDGPIVADEKASTFAQRPNFNITTMSNNFRRFNARIGVVFSFQADVERLLSWQRPSHTMSLLAVYTFVCLDPHLICVLPIAILVIGVLIPAFIARHPAPPKGTLSSEQTVGYSPRGPPLAPAATVRPAKELSRDFFRNMRDLQNCMEDFSVAHDQIITWIVPVTNFSNEAMSSAVFQLLVVGGILMTVTAHHLPWRFLFLVGGWVAICMGHPSVGRLMEALKKEHFDGRREEEVKSWLDNWIANDVILDSAPETREVEIFELQRISSAGEWEPWLFSPSPYDPLSHQRISAERPRGTRFFEDVMPPDGWEWSEKKWALDLWSREWVEERIITGVEVETEGERWVYDISVERDGEDRSGLADSPERERAKPKPAPQLSWEEGEDSTERRGEWRRRRWVRLVKRRVEVQSP